jgi:hypothetical protein
MIEEVEQCIYDYLTGEFKSPEIKDKVLSYVGELRPYMQLAEHEVQWREKVERYAFVVPMSEVEEYYKMKDKLLNQIKETRNEMS